MSRLSRCTHYRCSDVVKSFNKKSDEMKEQALQDGMKISHEKVTVEGFKLFYADRPQKWTPESGHEPYFGVFAFVSAHIADFGNGETKARIDYAFPAAYGHAPIYTLQFNKG